MSPSHLGRSQISPEIKLRRVAGGAGWIFSQCVDYFGVLYMRRVSFDSSVPVLYELLNVVIRCY